jgi:ParB family chromosome partitioning protein
VRLFNMKFPAFEPIDMTCNANSILVEDLQLTDVSPNPNQPRKNFDINALEELSSSIKQYGVMQPIIVRKISLGKYEIIAGERRWRASKLADAVNIPAIILENDAERNIAISLIENIQREELNPIELAFTFQQLSDEHGLSHEAIATMVGKSRATVTNLLRLLNLPDNVRALLISGKLEMGHARALLTLPETMQLTYAYRIIEKKLSVRETENLVKKSKQHNDTKPSLCNDEVKGWINELPKELASKLSVKMNGKGEGRVTIKFSSQGEFDYIKKQFKLDECLEPG